MSSFRQNSAAQQVIRRDNETLMPIYARYPVVMERGQGVHLFDTSGNRYLDMMAGMGVNALGHAHPRMVAAMVEQAGKIVHLSPQYVHRYSVDLAERLCDLSGMHGVFFSTGGTEAIEGALKLARTYGRQNFTSPKDRVVALRMSYHGRTYGSLAVTGQQKYSEDFGPSLPGTIFIDRNNIEQLREAMDGTVCAVVLEPILGEGGVWECSAEFLAEARRLATKFGALLMFDEIQCGLGRLGTWCAFESSGVRPDVLIFGKPLGGGIPLSAMLVTEPLFNAIGRGKHASTLGGTPMACRLGLEFISIVEDEDLLSQVTDTGAYLAQGLAEIARSTELAVESRGRGLLQALELSIPGRPLCEAALAEGLMLNCVQGNTLRFLPPFLLQRQHVDIAVECIGRLLSETASALDGSLATAGKA